MDGLGVLHIVSAVSLILLIVTVYFIPTMVAMRRHHRQAPAIATLNLLLGGTGVGWAVALVWAMTTPDV